jgi:Flp pilus assembly protein TadB
MSQGNGIETAEQQEESRKQIAEVVKLQMEAVRLSSEALLKEMQAKNGRRAGSSIARATRWAEEMGAFMNAIALPIAWVILLIFATLAIISLAKSILLS